MEKDERLAILKGLPKVELHRHLEGSIRLATMLELGRKNGVELPIESLTSLVQLVTYNEGEPRTLANFLQKFHAEWYRSYADVERVATEAVVDAAAEGVVHLELRFNPEHFIRHSGLQPEGVMEAITESVQEVADETGISVRFLITLPRGRYDEALWRMLITLSADMAEMGIRGVDLAGDEFSYPNQLFQKTFQRVQDTGILKASVHAGEGTSAAQVSSAIELLGASRIGHGTKAIEDPDTIALIKDRGVVLEMCPISNYQTGCIDDLEAHPLPLLDRQGVLVTINSDDPSIHRTTLNHDYDVALTNWGFTLDDLLRLERNAVQGAFLTDAEKKVLEEKIERGYQDSRNQGLI